MQTARSSLAHIFHNFRKQHLLTTHRLPTKLHIHHLLIDAFTDTLFHSFSYSLFPHPVRGDSHNQRYTTGEVATHL